MKITKHILVGLSLALGVLSCKESMKAPETPKEQIVKKVTAKDILGNPDYVAISYGGYRMTSRDSQPTIPQLKEDLKLLHAMDIKILRTYNVQLAQAPNILKAIKELKEEDVNFEMYVMLGAWIDCLNAWTDQEPNHDIESPDNAAEIDRAVALAQQYPGIVKVIAVGNEAMVKWATSYYVQPDVILKWVQHLQALKNKGTLSKDLWITSSDNFASWGGGENQYHVKALEELMAAVDYLSVHTYPMHDTHYNPTFWGVFGQENEQTHLEKIDAAMLRAKNYAIAQKDSVARYMKSLGISKPIHIGETGWASASNGLYGPNGSKATDEYKEALYYEHMRNWTNENGMSCFYFEAFDEPWKDAHNSGGSENHFGLFTVDGKAKYALWKLVDQGVFKGLTRNGNTITKTYNGDKEALLADVLSPPAKGKVVLN
ncbi:glycosyl hydrolase family 17 protein [uncultured Dokdonia sp.]|uniref:glycosyl hydrolase family 17 protein n=1 Tax=uncultured Dokdonia sp. TaxID=575653 RepID=UPI00262D9F87|nr:glycosyl hydrolase family 17 protein [uncultured Dokdonia sp.]